MILKKDNPLNFKNIITFVWHFGQKHDLNQFLNVGKA